MPIDCEPWPGKRSAMVRLVSVMKDMTSPINFLQTRFYNQVAANGCGWAYPSLRLRKKTQHFLQQPRTLIRVEDKLRMGGPFENHQLLWVGSFAIVFGDSWQSRTVATLGRRESR